MTPRPGTARLEAPHVERSGSTWADYTDGMRVLRVHADNYRCLVNFTFEPRGIALLLGGSGSGKSVCLELLDSLVSLIRGDVTVGKVFPMTTLTRWQARNVQTFELDVGEEADTFYRYRLDVEHDRDRERCRLIRETLHLGDRPLYAFSDGKVQLYRDDHSEGLVFSADWDRSGLQLPGSRHDNRKLQRFRDRIARIHVIKVDPVHMDPFSEREVARPGPEFRDFVSWYRFVIGESPDSLQAYHSDLRRVIEGLQQVRLHGSEGDERRTLRMEFDAPQGGVHRLRLDELSDGQRMLLANYGRLRFAVRPDATVCLDEPDNYLALAEIQPWLVEMENAVETASSQLFLVSHHPEVLDLLAPECGWLFERTSGGPTRVSPFRVPSGSLLSPSETVARGWESGAGE